MNKQEKPSVVSNVRVRRTLFSLLAVATFVLVARLAYAGIVYAYAMLTVPGGTVSNWTYLSTPDSDATQMYQVTPNGTPNGVVAINDNHPIGLWYDVTRRNWAVFNQDRAPMPSGTGFNVWSPQAASNVYVHTATAGNSRNSWTYLDNVWLNGNPNALIWATQNWNPNGRGGVYNPHTVGVWYDKSVNRWAVFNEDFSPMIPGASFNIVAESGANYPHFFVLQAPIRSPLVAMTINSVYSNNYPKAQIFITPVYNPNGATSGVFNAKQVIVRYNVSTRQWYMQNQDGSLIPAGAAFNVWVISHG